MLGIPRDFVIKLKNTFRHSGDLAHLFILKVEKILIVRLLVIALRWLLVL